MKPSEPQTMVCNIDLKKTWHEEGTEASSYSTVVFRFLGIPSDVQLEDICTAIVMEK